MLPKAVLDARLKDKAKLIALLTCHVVPDMLQWVSLVNIMS